MCSVEFSAVTAARVPWRRSETGGRWEEGEASGSCGARRVSLSIPTWPPPTRLARWSVHHLEEYVEATGKPSTMISCLLTREKMLDLSNSEVGRKIFLAISFLPSVCCGLKMPRFHFYYNCLAKVQLCDRLCFKKWTGACLERAIASECSKAPDHGVPSNVQTSFGFDLGFVL